MDMYALGRMTKSYNKNVVLLAGIIITTLHSLLEFVGKVLWNGEQLNEKCVRVPEWEPRNLLSLVFLWKSKSNYPLVDSLLRKTKMY